MISLCKSLVVKALRRAAAVCILATAAILALPGCSTTPKADIPRITDASSWQQIDSGVDRYRATIVRDGNPETVWLYEPDPRPAGKLPCILIAPAGSHLFDGMVLGQGDEDEHIPYVKNGMIVVAYSLDGNLLDPNNIAGDAVAKAARKFKDADFGYANAKAGLDFAQAHLDNIDPARIYSAGHSSAGTVSLHVAERDPRIAGCIAYAPEPDVETHITPQLIGEITKSVDGYAKAVHDASPINSAAALRCPVFIFHADDDTIVPTEHVTRFVQAVQATNPQVAYIRVGSGGHFDSMLSYGVPDAIWWIKHGLVWPRDMTPLQAAEDSGKPVENAQKSIPGVSVVNVPTVTEGQPTPQPVVGVPGAPPNQVPQRTGHLQLQHSAAPSPYSAEQQQNYAQQQGYPAQPQTNSGQPLPYYAQPQSYPAASGANGYPPSR